ncbi:hypothetical protein [Actinomadura terrae]|uniref:hypothetical protein n=1 Tax=Actinomadura terrae TaxID=604353 RepID=UPI001FA709D2|nr:hypothetical protein [Actinomadura terrae]
MKLDKAISEVQDAEADLAKELRRVSERHAAEHDIHHLGLTLARQCADHVERLAPFAERYGASGREVADSPGLLDTLRHASARLAGRSEMVGMLLLRDLRNLYLGALEAEIAWTILGQAAQAARDRDLLQTVGECHEAAETRGKWLRTRIKVTAPQVLVSG